MADLERESLHVEPTGLLDTARHYIRDLVYGAIDGIITTFAVVAGVSGGNLSAGVILIVGVANLSADGLSMGVGNYLGIRSEEGVRKAQQLPEQEAQPGRHGLATFIAFVVAGIVPLTPYFLPSFGTSQFALSIALTMASLFGVGALRSIVTVESWWRSGLEILGLGLAVAVAAYGTGMLIARIAPGV